MEHCESHHPGLLDLFISSDPSISSLAVFHLLRISNHVVVSVSIDFSSENAPFNHTAYGYSCANGNEVRDHLQDASQKYDVYIPR